MRRVTGELADLTGPAGGDSGPQRLTAPVTECDADLRTVTIWWAFPVRTTRASCRVGCLMVQQTAHQHRSGMLLWAVLAATLLAGTTASAAASPSAVQTGGVGIRLVDVPAAARTDPRARIYIVDHLAPGTVIHRRIEVSNTTSANVHVALYAAAAVIVKGSFDGSAGHTRNDLSTWTSVSPDELDVAKGGSAIPTVTIRVPRDAAPGEQYGVVWAEVRSGSGSASGVTQVSRVGIRLYISVGAGGAPAADFSIESLTAERLPNSRPEVLATVRNTGGRALDMSGVLLLSDGPGGIRAGPFTAELGTTLAIGDTEPVAIALDQQLPAGPWTAAITLRSGLLERSAKARITFPAKGAAAPVKPEVGRSSWLYLPIGGGLLLAAVVGVLVGLRRRRSGE